MELTSETQKESININETKNLKKIEAALFISARWLSVRELVELTDINPLLLKELLKKLKHEYEKRDTAIVVLNKDDIWKMDIKQEYSVMINKIATGSAEFTKAEQETLAIIAYKQPVKQSVIVNIRGNKAYEHIKHFINVGLLRGKKMGHTIELALTENFYDYFHLENKGADELEERENKEETEEKSKGVEKVREKEIGLKN